jgi:hypothetical protein
MKLNKNNIVIELEMEHWQMIELIWDIEQSISNYIIDEFNKGFFELSDFWHEKYKEYDMHMFQDRFFDIKDLIELHKHIDIIANGDGDSNRQHQLFKNILNELKKIDNANKINKDKKENVYYLAMYIDSHGPEQKWIDNDNIYYSPEEITWQFNNKTKRYKGKKLVGIRKTTDIDYDIEDIKRMGWLEK